MRTPRGAFRRFFARSLPVLAFAVGQAEGAAIMMAARTAEARPMQSWQDAAHFAGDYDSNWGSCTFTQSDARIAASCERGYKLTCWATGATMDCDWISPRYGTHGKTRLTLDADGRHMNGPWGNDESVTGGGMWNFTRR